MILNNLKYIWLPSIIALIILYLCCFIPIDDIPDISDKWGLDIPIDKIGHFCMFFGLSAVSAMNYIYIERGNIKLLRLLIGSFLIPILYGGVIELLQYGFFAPRTGDWFDFLADILGSIAAYPIAIWFRQYIIK